MNPTASDPNFILIRRSHVASVNIDIEEYNHRSTGAKHIHLATDDDQNAFLVAFKTVPQDSTGVAHILEHTSLCGSQKYPVRDPFFMMTRRSLNTFMNAFTSSDWTAYPFASRNRKDFDNLLRVYLDAVFFPILNELDFAQEGHRVEFSESDNPASDLVFKGVVFNEMKGAMSSPASTLWQTLTRELFPTITYHHNSGGDPEHIPDLSYAQLKAFHACHYHPSNALFMTFGDTPATHHQALFHSEALRCFEHRSMNLAVPDEERYAVPRQAEKGYALDGEEETAGKTHIVIGWLLGRSTDMESVMRAHLLSGVLLDNSASPLRHALETSHLGSAPSQLCGLYDGNREMVFSCGLEGSEAKHADEVEKLILDVLREVAENGVPQERVAAVLHQLELSQREISGDGFPFGLQLMVQALAPVLHGADAVTTINIDPVLNRLHDQIQDPGFIKEEARTLLDNPHRVRLAMHPDPGLSAYRAAAEAERLASMKAEMNDAEKAQIVATASALSARQQQTDDPEQLPRVGIEDIPVDLSIPEGEAKAISGIPATWYTRGTNGLIYQQIVVELPELDGELIDLLPLFNEIITEVGSAGRDYLATQILQAAVTGGIGASVSVRATVDDTQRNRGFFTLSGKALVRNQAALTDLMFETLESARFDELPRLRELVSQERMQREQSVTGHGHSLAMLAAASSLSPVASLNHGWGGLAGIKALKNLDERLSDSDKLATFAARLEQLHTTILAAPRQLLLVGEAEHNIAVEQTLAKRWQGHAQGDPMPPFSAPTPHTAPKQGWATSTQVNFCARAYPTVAFDHPDAAALTVLASFLRNNFLHRAVREQGGAYGGGASFDPDCGAFRFYSYRDPRLGETLRDFDASVQWLLESTHEWRFIEEAILGVISGIDKPGSPAGEAKKAFHAALHGRTPEQRRRFRSQILKVREDDLKRVAFTYLQAEKATTAVISNPTTLADHTGLKLEINKL